jgi:hypothetical protein
MVKVQTEETHKPTCNGILKGRPGKGNVLSLEQRKRCYAGHAMTEANTFRYKAILKRDKNGKPSKFAPVRAWCKRCRTDSRKRSVAKRLESARAEATAKAERNAKARDRRTAKRTAKAA